MKYKQQILIVSDEINTEDYNYAERNYLLLENHENLNDITRKNETNSNIFPDAEEKIKSSLKNCDSGIQGGNFRFGIIKHEANSMISKQKLKGFTDIVIMIDWGFYMLHGDKSITISDLNPIVIIYNSHCIQQEYNHFLISP